MNKIYVIFGLLLLIMACVQSTESPIDDPVIVEPRIPGDSGLTSDIPASKCFAYDCGPSSCEITCTAPRAWLEDAATAITCLREGRYENVSCAGATLAEKGDIMMLEIENHIIGMKQSYERNIIVDNARDGYTETNPLE